MSNFKSHFSGTGHSFSQFQLPEDIFERKDTGKVGTAEKKMLAAMLGRALLDALGPAFVERHYRRGAKHWLLAKRPKKKNETCFSVWDCCEALEFDCTHLQNVVRAALTTEVIDESLVERISRLAVRF